MAWLLCMIGLHRWKRLADTLGGCGMGLEWFECWECERCTRTFDQLRGGGMAQYGWRDPHENHGGFPGEFS